MCLALLEIIVVTCLTYNVLQFSQVVGMYACYLISAIVITPLVLGEHTSVEERYPRTTSKFW